MFGEDENDTKAIKELLLALCPELNGKIKALSRPPILIRDADPKMIQDRVSVIADLIAIEKSVNDVICVFAHEDCDDFEPAHEAVARKIEEALAGAGHKVHAVTPAWEIEAWWFQWPEAVQAHRRAWRSLASYKGRDLGRIRDAKEELRRALRPTDGGKPPRDYRASDSIGIAAKVRELGCVASPQATSNSFERFRNAAHDCCTAVGT